MIRAWLAAVAVVAVVTATLLCTGIAAADSHDGQGAALEAAEAALQASEYARAAALAEPVTAAASHSSPADRAEAWRILGLARYFLADLPRAEAAFLACLQLDLDARLDPSLVPPEAVTFFEDVRSRHASELRRYRPRPRSRILLSLLPPAGQFDTGHRVRGWILVSAGAALLAANVTTYMLLREWCADDLTCDGARGQSADRARTARSINLATGSALIGLYAFGVVDAAIAYWRSGRHDETPPASTSWSLLPTGDGAIVSLQHRF